MRTIGSPNESSDEDFTHDQLMDEDQFRRVTMSCDYMEDRDCPEETYNYYRFVLLTLISVSSHNL